MDYKDMLKAAIGKGQSSEKIMWQSVDAIDTLLESVKENDPTMYWQFLRETHESLYGRHYDEEFAKHDIEGIRYTDRQRMMHKGAHWTADQVEAATSGFTFPPAVTKWDKFVAFNSSYADLNRALDEPTILKAAHAFWFDDEDWSESGSATKIWDYMSAKCEM